MNKRQYRWPIYVLFNHATISYFEHTARCRQVWASKQIHKNSFHFHFEVSYRGQRQLAMTPHCNPYPVLRWLYAVQLCLPHWDKSWYPRAGLLLKLKPLCRPSEEHEEANSPHWSSGGRQKDGLAKPGWTDVQNLKVRGILTMLREIAMLLYWRH